MLILLCLTDQTFAPAKRLIWEERCQFNLTLSFEVPCHYTCRRFATVSCIDVTDMKTRRNTVGIAIELLNFVEVDKIARLRV